MLLKHGRTSQRWELVHILNIPECYVSPRFAVMQLDNPSFLLVRICQKFHGLWDDRRYGSSCLSSRRRLAGTRLTCLQPMGPLPDSSQMQPVKNQELTRFTSKRAWVILLQDATTLDGLKLLLFQQQPYGQQPRQRNRALFCIRAVVLSFPT